jgi:hypothetical protein
MIIVGRVLMGLGTLWGPSTISRPLLSFTEEIRM